MTFSIMKRYILFIHEITHDAVCELIFNKQSHKSLLILMTATHLKHVFYSFSKYWNKNTIHMYSKIDYDLKYI